jgi:intracellular septation protein A
MKNLFNAFRPLLADFLSTIIFVAFYAITGSIRDAIVLGIAVGIGQIGFMLITRRPVAALQWVSLVLVITMGSATLVTNDPRFVMVKPSIGFFAVGLVMLKKGWMGRYLPPIVQENLDPAIPIRWGYVWSATMAVLGASNLVVAFLVGPKAWAWFISAVPTAAQLLLFAVQYVSIRARVARNIRAAHAAEGNAGASPAA